MGRGAFPPPRSLGRRGNHGRKTEPAPQSPRPHTARYRWADVLTGYGFTSPAIILMLLLIFVPIGYTLYLSLFDTRLSNPNPVFLGLKGFVAFFQSHDALMAVRNSFVWTIVVAAFQFVVGLGTALILNRQFRLRWLGRSVIIIPWVIPGVIAGMVWRLLDDAQFGFLNTLLARLGIAAVHIDWLGLPGLAMFSVVVTAIWKGFGFLDAHVPGGPADGTAVPLRVSADRRRGRGAAVRIHLRSPYCERHPHHDPAHRHLDLQLFRDHLGDDRGGPIRSTHIAPTYIYELAFMNFNFGNASRFAVLSFLLVSVLSIQYIRMIFRREKL